VQPYLFFGGGSGGSKLASGWQDAGKFLVGFSAVAAVSEPGGLLLLLAGHRSGVVAPLLLLPSTCCAWAKTQLWGMTGSCCPAPHARAHWPPRMQVAIPTILYHSQKITAGALWMELAAMGILGGTVLAWQFFSENEGSSPFYY
jgi:hypothetical protein